MIKINDEQRFQINPDLEQGRLDCNLELERNTRDQPMIKINDEQRWKINPDLEQPSTIVLVRSPTIGNWTTHEKPIETELRTTPGNLLRAS